MFKRIAIKNFKAFSEWQEINLSPITLIYGPNSAGKSSIIHAIMLLKQSLTRPATQGGLISCGEFVDLGDYSSMIYGHDIEKEMEFKFTFEPTKKLEKNNAIFKIFGGSYDHEYKLNFGYSSSTSENVNSGFTYLKDFSVNVVDTLKKKNYEIFNSSFKSRLTHNNKKSHKEQIISAQKFIPKDKESRLSLHNFITRRKVSDINIKDFENYLDYTDLTRDLNFTTPSMLITESKPLDQLSHLNINLYLNMTMTELATELKQKFNSISYLGPLRSHPSRFYAPKGDQGISVGKQGENIAKLIFDNPKEVTSKINYWFSEFEIPYDLTVQPIGDIVTGTVLSLQLKDSRTNVVVGPADVGFGIGQILPIIVEGIVRENCVICVEQPEIHLHPRLQAHLANFFVETCGRNQWIIETHSESLMLRLQNLIKRKSKTGPAPETISIIYVDPGEKGGEVIQIPIDDDGDFMKTWPQGFFEERIKEKLGGI